MKKNHHILKWRSQSTKEKVKHIKKIIRLEIEKEINPLQEKIAELYAENLRLKIALGGM